MAKQTGQLSEKALQLITDRLEIHDSLFEANAKMIKEQSDSLNTQKKGMDVVMILTTGSTIVVMIALVTLVVTGYAAMVDANNFKSSTYQTLVDKVNTLVQSNQEKEKTENQIKLEELQNQMDTLKIKNPYLK